MVFFTESLKNKRSNNEDSFCAMEIRVNHEAKVNAFCVADGMGGLEAGKEYSSKAVSLWFENLTKILMKSDFVGSSLPEQIETLFEFSKEIFQTINKHLYEKGMDAGLVGGTTLSTAIHFWDTWILGNCGDSPIYMLKDDRLEMISEVQNVAWQMVREEKTQIGSTIFYQNKNRLLEFLGRREPVNPYVRKMEDTGIDSILIGSDGAFGDLTLNKMENFMNQFKGQQEALSTILAYAREHGESDNQTAIIIYPPIKKKKEVKEDIFLCKEGKDFVAIEQECSVYREMEEPPLAKRFLSYLMKNGKGRS